MKKHDSDMVMNCPICGHRMLINEPVCWDCWLTFSREGRRVPDDLFADRDKRIENDDRDFGCLLANYEKDSAGFFRLREARRPLEV